MSSVAHCSKQTVLDQVDDLDLEALQECSKQIEERIRRKLEEPRRIAWKVVVRGGVTAGIFDSDEYAKAWACLVDHYEDFAKEALIVLIDKSQADQFAREVPHIEVMVLPQSEYEEMFPGALKPSKCQIGDATSPLNADEPGVGHVYEVCFGIVRVDGVALSLRRDIADYLCSSVRESADEDKWYCQAALAILVNEFGEDLTQHPVSHVDFKRQVLKTLGLPEGCRLTSAAIRNAIRDLCGVEVNR